MFCLELNWIRLWMGCNSHRWSKPSLPSFYIFQSHGGREGVEEGWEEEDEEDFQLIPYRHHIELFLLMAKNVSWPQLKGVDLEFFAFYVHRSPPMIFHSFYLIFDFSPIPFNPSIPFNSLPSFNHTHNIQNVIFICFEILISESHIALILHIQYEMYLFLFLFYFIYLDDVVFTEISVRFHSNTTTLD